MPEILTSHGLTPQDASIATLALIVLAALAGIAMIGIIHAAGRSKHR